MSEKTDTGENRIKQLLEIVEKYSKNNNVKSRNLTPSSLDYVIEIKCENEIDLIHELLTINAVTSASILSHDGEFQQIKG